MSDWIRQEDTPDLLKFDSSFSSEDETIELESSDLDVESESLDKKPKDTLAKKFINLLGQGYKPGEAAKLVGTSIRGIMSQKAFRDKVKNLVDTYNLTPDIRRAMVRAGLNQIAMDGLNSTDPSEKKLALDALKVIGSDTEVGTNAPPQPAVQINVGNLEELFTKLDSVDTIDVEPVREKINAGNNTTVFDSTTISNLAPKIEEAEDN